MGANKNERHVDLFDTNCNFFVKQRCKPPFYAGRLPKTEVSRGIIFSADVPFYFAREVPFHIGNIFTRQIPSL
jgi:hypothetical protein